METNKPHPTGLQWDLSKITKGTGLGERSIDDSHCYRQPHSVSPWPLRVHSHATPSTINSTQGQYSECSSPVSPCPSPTALQAYCRWRPLNVCWRNDLVNAVWSLKCAFCASSFYERCIIPWPFRVPFNHASRLKPDSFSWPWIAYSSFLWYYPAAWMQALRQVYPLTGPTSLKPCGLKWPSCVVPPSSVGWPGSSTTGLTWTHSLGCSQAILPSSVVEPSRPATEATVVQEGKGRSARPLESRLWDQTRHHFYHIHHSKAIPWPIQLFLVGRNWAGQGIDSTS